MIFPIQKKIWRYNSEIIPDTANAIKYNNIVKTKNFDFIEVFLICTCMYVQSAKKENYTPTYFNTNYRTKMKLVSIIMDYCFLQFDALKLFLGVHLHGRSQPNFNSFNINPQILQRNREVHLTNCLETNFHDISIISLRVIRRRNYS